MTNLPTLIITTLLLTLTPKTLGAPLQIVSTLPDLAAIAQAVGGDHVKTQSLARGTEDPHFVDPRPSFIRILNRCDVLLHGGADLEAGWLPPLIQNARNRRILPGQPGNIAIAQAIPLLEIPNANIDRSQGDIHAAGNPHFWLNPTNNTLIALYLAKQFSQLDPTHADTYIANAHHYQTNLEHHIQSWNKQLAPLSGSRIIAYHKTFEYLAQAFHLQIVNYIEPFPGIEPSPAHVTRLINEAKNQNIQLVITEPFRPSRTPKLVAETINAQLITLPDKVGALPDITDAISLFDTITKTLVDSTRQP
jgi:zinc/manganese transport system substrate-binding protein